MDFKSYYFSLPNKFFEAIQSETPLVINQYPEMVQIMDHYKFGLHVDTSDIDQVINALEKMRGDTDFYNECKKNIAVAKKELCWENEKKELMRAYRSVMSELDS